MRRLLVLLPILLGLAACDRPAPAPRTAEELRAAIAGYKDGKADVTERQIDALFARLDAEFATQRADAMTRTADAGDAFKQMGDSIGKGLEDAGRKLRESMQGQADRAD